MAADASVPGFGVRVARRALKGSLPSDMVAELIENRVRAEPHLVPDYDAMSNEQARLHFGAHEPLEYEHMRRSVRYFHAWKLNVLRERIGPRLGEARILDVGDTDGLLRKHLGKDGLGFNLAPAAVANIQSNGMEARLGDGQELPFDDGAFDCVFCFETLEHVEDPIRLLGQLERVCVPGGRVFVSIPWVPRTFIHARDPATNRGSEHIFEFSRRDFGSLLTHTPLNLRWEAVCDLIGSPTRPSHRVFLAATRRSHVLGGVFRRFQFFELEPAAKVAGHA